MTIEKIEAETGIKITRKWWQLFAAMEVAEMRKDTERNQAEELAAELCLRAERAFRDSGDNEDCVGSFTSALTELFKPDEIKAAHERAFGETRNED